MTSPTFKPTHVRCIEYYKEEANKYLTEGNIYKIVYETNSTVFITCNKNEEYESLVVFREELKSNTSSGAKFRYVGPPAILGEPKTITEGLTK